MKKKLILFIFIILTFLRTIGQINNLVPNPSFEDYFLEFYPQFGCDTLAKCLNWISPTDGSPDYFNEVSCLNNGVPSNYFGFQYAYDGKGYHHFESYWFYDTTQVASPPHREYIQVELKELLKQGKEYCVSFYVSLDDSSWFAIDRIGAYFSDTAIRRTDWKNFNFAPQIYSKDSFFITDKEKWSLINGHFTANGGEKYITIGNFFDGFQTHVINSGLPKNEDFNVADYYIDMVSVYDCDDTIRPEPEKKNVVYVPNAFSPNNDGTNDVLYVRGENIKEATISIYNRWGEKVFESNDVTKGWDSNYKGKPCPAEVYFYYMNVTFNNGSIENKSGNVTLVR